MAVNLIGSRPALHRRKNLWRFMHSFLPDWDQSGWKFPSMGYNFFFYIARCGSVAANCSFNCQCRIVQNGDECAESIYKSLLHSEVAETIPHSIFRLSLRKLCATVVECFSGLSRTVCVAGLHFMRYSKLNDNENCNQTPTKNEVLNVTTGLQN